MTTPFAHETKRPSLARRRSWTIVTLVAAVCTIGGCDSEADRQAELANGSDSLQALGATVESTRYTAAFWTQQADSNPSLFARARAFCDAQWASESGQKVNCGAVAAAVFEHSGHRTAPKRPRRDPRTMVP
jgi:hypothetical protein